LTSPAAKGLKQNAKAAFTNSETRVLANRLRANVEAEFHMSPAQEARLEAQKKRLGEMIKKLGGYVAKTAHVTDKPKWMNKPKHLEYII